MKGTLQKEHRVPTDGNKGRVDFVTPAVNIFETKDGYMVEAEMPGVTKDGLEVTLEGNEITIVGHRTPDAVDGTGFVLRVRECRLPSCVRDGSGDRQRQNFGENGSGCPNLDTAEI